MTYEIRQPNAHLNQTDRLAIERVEDEYNGYMREHYGPLWGEQNEVEVSRIQRRLRRLYDQHNVEDFDRIAGV